MPSVKTPSAPTDHYTIISADCHAGGSHAMYREYLDPAYRDDFDAWRNKYKNPYRDLRDTDLRIRNWDDERRQADMEADGVVGEVVFPNTVPPFFPSFVLFARPPEPDEYEHRLAGIRAHNRWLVDFCNAYPVRRAGIGQIFLNDVDDAMDDVRWIKEHGLRGGVLLPNIPPDVKWVAPLYDPLYDPLWALCQELEVPVNAHGGTGSPDYGNGPTAALLQIAEVPFYSQRPFVQFVLSGVFERFPGLKFVMTEMGASWIPAVLAQLDGIITSIRDKGEIGELKYTKEHVLSRTPTEYFHQNCWVATSQPGPADAAVRKTMAPDRFLWGSDYPHDEGTGPFTREHLRQVFHDAEPGELHAILAGNAAKLYDFDLDALAPAADEFGPTVAEIAEPLVELPENANMALIRGARGSKW
jgi:predicted TIM-barrel fold metal-dependent hydrolase